MSAKEETDTNTSDINESGNGLAARSNGNGLASISTGNVDLGVVFRLQAGGVEVIQNYLKENGSDLRTGFQVNAVEMYFNEESFPLSDDLIVRSDCTTEGNNIAATVSLHVAGDDRDGKKPVAKAVFYANFDR